MSEEHGNGGSKGGAPWGKGEYSGEDVKKILEGVTELFGSIRESLSEILEKTTEMLDGDKVGRDVAMFYKSLKEAGLPDEMVTELTKEYFRKRMEAANILEIVKEIF